MSPSSQRMTNKIITSNQRCWWVIRARVWPEGFCWAGWWWLEAERACCCFTAGNPLSAEIKEISQCFSTSVPCSEIRPSLYHILLGRASVFRKKKINKSPVLPLHWKHVVFHCISSCLISLSLLWHWKGCRLQMRNTDRSFPVISSVNWRGGINRRCQSGNETVKTGSDGNVSGSRRIRKMNENKESCMAACCWAMNATWMAAMTKFRREDLFPRVDRTWALDFWLVLCLAGRRL